MTLAKASNATLIGFNVRPNKEAKKLAESHNITIKYYNIIYEVLDFINDLLSGLLKPDVKEEIVGSATVQAIFTVPKVGKVAGSKVIDGEIINNLKATNYNKEKIILCGGGRKNHFLIKRLKEENRAIKLIDEYGVDGDFVESQAFAYLAIRSYLKLPISFPSTTGVSKPCSGGVIVKN